MTDGCTDTQQRTRKYSDTPHSSPDVGPTQGHTRARAHTQVRPRATRTSCTGTRAGPSAADCEKVAALTRHVYLLICINERLYPIPPASRGWGRCICPWRGTLNRTCIEVPPTLRGGQRWATKLGGLEVSERRDCSVGGLGSGQGEGNIGVL